jgi:hypothetical protein
MTDPNLPASRRFNEKEVAQIIKRASELQQEESSNAPSTASSRQASTRRWCSR